MDDKKDGRDYSDFFDSRDKYKEDNENRENASAEDQVQEQRSDKPAYYYSYGPFKSGANSSEGGLIENRSSYTSEHGEQTDVEIERPRALTPSPYDNQPPAGGGVVYPRRRQASWKGIFAGFVAGAIMIAVLMFVADYYNLFTGQQEQAQGSGTETEQYFNYDRDDQSIRNASLEISGSSTIADMVEQSNPAVVKIETYGNASNRSGNQMDEFFRDFFSSPSPESSEQRRPMGEGSGFFFDSEGYILTNEHVLNGAEEIYVTVMGHTERYKAELLGSDFDLDLAVLKISGDGDFPSLPFGDSSALRSGDWLVAIGNPRGFNHSVSVGVLSAVEREISIRDTRTNGHRRYEHLLQTDAAINPGNSGGPLLNLNGEVIGINTAVSTQAQGIGFAIPSSTVEQVLEHLKNNQTIPRPFLGVEYTQINESWLNELGLEDSAEGVVVLQVISGSPASRSGIRPYDVIIEVDGEAITQTQDLQTMITSKEVGQRLNVTIIREGQQIETVVTLIDRNAQQ